MIITLIKGCMVLDTWQEPGYCFECDDKYAQHFLNAGVAMPPDLAEHQGKGHSVETADHPGHGKSEKGVSRPQR